MKKEQIYAPLAVGLALVFFIIVIYFTSARFVEPPKITLPAEAENVIDKTEYESIFKYEDIEITLENYKEIISNLTRPKSYSFTVINEILAFSSGKTVEKTVIVDNGNIIATDGVTEFKTVGETVVLTTGEHSKTFARSLYTNDEIIGIPTYENILNDSFRADFVEFIEENNEDVLKIHEIAGTSKNIYTISLATGLLVQYEMFEEETLVRNVKIVNLEY